MITKKPTETAVARQGVCDEGSASGALFGVRLADTVTDLCAVHLPVFLAGHLDEAHSIVPDAPQGAKCGDRRDVAIEIARLDVERVSRSVGYDVYRARLLESGAMVGETVTLEDFEVTLEPQTQVDLFTAAAVAAERLAAYGYRVFEEFTGRGEHGSAVMSR